MTTKITNKNEMCVEKNTGEENQPGSEVLKKKKTPNNKGSHSR